MTNSSSVFSFVYFLSFLCKEYKCGKQLLSISTGKGGDVGSLCSNRNMFSSKEVSSDQNRGATNTRKVTNQQWWIYVVNLNESHELLTDPNWANMMQLLTLKCNNEQSEVMREPCAAQTANCHLVTTRVFKYWDGSESTVGLVDSSTYWSGNEAWRTF